MLFPFLSPCSLQSPAKETHPVHHRQHVRSNAPGEASFSMGGLCLPHVPIRRHHSRRASGALYTMKFHHIGGQQVNSSFLPQRAIFCGMEGPRASPKNAPAGNAIPAGAYSIASDPKGGRGRSATHHRPSARLARFARALRASASQGRICVMAAGSSSESSSSRGSSPCLSASSRTDLRVLSASRASEQAAL